MNMLRVAPPTVTPSYTNGLTADLHGGPGAITPTRADAHSKRKQTLLSLLDALSELSKDEDLRDPDSKQAPTYDEGRDIPIVDEDQVVGAEVFFKFQRRIQNLDKELRNFANSARQLGSSVGILSSSFHLRERLVQILYLFRENAADLFPRKVTHQPREALVNPNSRYRRRIKRKTPNHVVRPAVSAFEKLDPEDFPEQLEMFARDVVTFLKCLNEFPEFQDEAVNSSIHALQGDLKYWASCLKAYEGQFKYPAVQRYLHDLTSEMGEHLETITSNLGLFIEIGVPTIRFAQKHGASNLLNLSTVATFFSAVTATTLQYSYQSTGDVTGHVLDDAVNAFWFTSMVFSIGAAVNSLLGVTWKQAMYRSPGHRVPWWVLIWIKRSPLVFLVISVACFSVGLVLFTYSSNQNRVVCTITTVFTAFSSFGLAAVSAWVASERWIFAKHKGQKWLGDVLTEVNGKITYWMGIKWVKKTSPAVAKAVVGPLRRASTSFSRMGSWTMSMLSIDDEKADDDGADPSPRFVGSPEPMTPTSPPWLPGISESIEVSHSTSKGPPGQSTDQEKMGNEKAGPSSAPGTTAKSRFANVVRNVIMLQTASSPISLGPTRRNPRRQRTMSSSDGSTTQDNLGPFAAVRRVAALSQRLKTLEVTQEFQPHQALVRHLQFSPNGKFLATSSWDRTSMIFRVEDSFVHHRTLAHPQGFVGQAAWSPSGNLLLTKLSRSVKVWTQDGVCRKTIDRHRAVHSIAWFPGGEAFMSVEGSSVTKLDLAGKIYDTYHFDRLMLHDVAVTPDCKRLLGVGTLLQTVDGLHPSKSRAEKQIIVYNLDKRKIENQVPVLHDVRDITLSKNGKVALVSYENKAPPQLWKLDPVKGKETEGNIVRLSLRHTYQPKMPVDFAGPSYFGGKDDQLIFCAGKAGDIHIWDRESGEILHYLRAQQGTGGDLTSIAWNQGSDTFMFATGSHDGYLKTWMPRSNSPPEQLRPVFGTGGTTTPRSDSPFGLDIECRADSPSQQDQDFDSQDGHTAESSKYGSSDLLTREKRAVSFVT